MVIFGDSYILSLLLDATKFVSANYMPVKLQGATDSDSPAADIEQLAVQNAAASKVRLLDTHLTQVEKDINLILT